MKLFINKCLEGLSFKGPAKNDTILCRFLLQQEALVNLEKLESKHVKQGKAEIVGELRVRFLVLRVAWFH